MLHLFYGWELASLDIRDAYLTVEQQETCCQNFRLDQEVVGFATECIVAVAKGTSWSKEWCTTLVSRFYPSFAAVGIQMLCCCAFSVEACYKQIAINVHVDDELIASEKEADLLWVVSELKKIYKLQMEGLVPQVRLGAGEDLSYLKKTYIFLEDGVCIKSNPNPKYIDNLLKLCNGNRKRGKCLNIVFWDVRTFLQSWTLMDKRCFEADWGLRCIRHRTGAHNTV